MRIERIGCLGRRIPPQFVQVVLPGRFGHKFRESAEHLGREREQVTLDAGRDVPVNVEIERGLDSRQFP